MDQLDSERLRSSPNDAAPRGVGDNSAGSEFDQFDLETLLNPAVLRDQLELDYADHVARRDELLAGVDRFFAAVKQITDDETQAKASDFVAQLQAHHKAVEADRAAWQRPFLASQATGQKFFKAEMLDRLKGAADDIAGKMAIYANHKRQEAQRALEAQRRAAAAEAEAKRAAAEASMRPSQLEEASKAAAKAEKVEQKASRATAADLTRVRGDLGSVASLKVSYGWEVTNLDLVPRELLTLDGPKVQAMINAGTRDGADGKPAIPGLRIVETSSVRVRS